MMKNQMNLILPLSIVIGSVALGIFYYSGKQCELKAKSVELKIKAVELQMEQLKSGPKTILIGKDTILYDPLYSYDSLDDHYTLISYFYKYTDKGMKSIKTYGEN